jgi:hypothetical protein
MIKNFKASLNKEHSKLLDQQWGLQQPDWVLVSQHHKRIAGVDLCRPSDVPPAQLLARVSLQQCGNSRHTYLCWN